jgi:hypothetical protein
MAAATRSDERTDVAGTVRIVHDIPGRLRLRLPRGTSATGVQDVVDRLNGAHGSVWSPRTRSLLIRYDAGVLTRAEIARAVAEHADLDLQAPSENSPPDDGRPVVATAVASVFNNFNERVARRTRGRLDLGLLVSVGLVLWAGRQLLRGPVTSLSWTSALWYAHGLFRDYTARER